jgi:hypothetical protein
MPTHATTKKDIAASIVPPITNRRNTVGCNSRRSRGRIPLHVRFADSLEGEVDMSKRVRSPRAGVFTELADPDVFAQASRMERSHGRVNLTWRRTHV